MFVKANVFQSVLFSFFPKIFLCVTLCSYNEQKLNTFVIYYFGNYSLEKNRATLSTTFAFLKFDLTRVSIKRFLGDVVLSFLSLRHVVVTRFTDVR